MTEQTNAESITTEQNGSPVKFNVRRIFLKDASLETPLGFDAFRQEWKPTFSQDISTQIRPAGDNLYECTLTVTLTAKLEEGEKTGTAFIIEVQQAGIFMLEDAEEKQRHFILNTMAPNILFPYTREVVDSLANKGSFPPPNMPPINFQGLYQQAQAQNKEAEQANKH